MTLVELCAGTAALSLRALAGHPIDPLTGFMGGKRRWAGEIAELLGVHRERPDRVVLVDAGPWGEVWDLLRDRDAREGVAGLLDAWDREVASDRPTLVTALWLRLAERPPAEDPVDRVAQYLWIQARSATGIPVWWSGSEWVGPTGAKWAPSTSSLVGGGAGRQAGRRPDGAVYGPDSPATIARRIRALDAIDWSRVEVRRCPVQDVEPMPGATVYFDPPYQGAPRYAVLLAAMGRRRVPRRGLRGRAPAAGGLDVLGAPPLRPRARHHLVGRPTRRAGIPTARGRAGARPLTRSARRAPDARRAHPRSSSGGPGPSRPGAAGRSPPARATNRHPAPPPAGAPARSAAA